jgi:polysaccharide biosynthesis protein PslH
MRILFVLVSLPFPANLGQRVRNHSLLRALRMEGHKVTLVAFGDQEELRIARCGLSELCADLRVIQRPSDAPHIGYAGRLRALLSGLPYGAWRMRFAPMSAAVRNLLTSQHFDLILCDDVYQMENLPKGSSVPTVLNKHDITYEIVERFLKHERNPLKLVYGWIEHRWLRQLETRACGAVAAVWVCSERDRQILAKEKSFNHSVPFAVVPNVVDVEDYEPAETDDGRTVLYVGAMDWLPNRDAVEFFVSEVMPELRRLVPDFSFVVAGREPAPDFRKRFEQVPNVKFTGTLPDLRPLIAQAAICVVPLRIGSGTRLKILEAAAMAKPVVSTTIGAEGLSFVDGREILIADEPGKTAQVIAHLLKNRPRRQEIGRAARRRVAAEYSISTLRRSLHEAMAVIGGLSPNDVTCRESSLGE